MHVSYTKISYRERNYSWRVQNGFILFLWRIIAVLNTHCCLRLLTTLFSSKLKIRNRTDTTKPSVFSGFRVTRSLDLCVCFVDRCLSFLFWPLCCLSFFALRILITPLVSSNSSLKQSIFILKNRILWYYYVIISVLA